MELKKFLLLLLLFLSALFLSASANAPTPPAAAAQAKPSQPPPVAGGQAKPPPVAVQPPPVAGGQAKPTPAAVQPPPVAGGQAKSSPPPPVAAPAKPPGVEGPSQAPKAGPSQAPKAAPSQPPKANSPISLPPQPNSPKANSPKANSPADGNGRPAASPTKEEDDGEAPAMSPGPSSDDRHMAFVLGTHMKKGASEAESAVEFITKRMEKVGEGAEMECLHQCEDNYRSMVDAFKKANEDFSDNDFGFVGDDLSAIAADMEACQHCYKEKANGTPSPLTKFEESIKKATDDSLALLQKSS